MINQAKSILLLGVLSALLVFIGGLFSPEYVGGFLVFALLMNVGAYFFSDRIVLAMNRAHPVSPQEYPELHNMVAELARRAELPMPRVYIIEEMQANAFATGRNPKHGVVAVTRGIMQILNERELRGVIAHELAHIKNRDILLSSIAAVLASVIGYVAQAASWGFIGGRSDDDREGGSPVLGLLIMLIAPIGAMFIQYGISRSREYLADETGAKIAGDAEGLAGALLKLERGAARMPADVQPASASMYIVNPLKAGFSGGRMFRLFSTHPPIEERVARLRELRVSDLRS
jgi:heat shock protein HtpX